MPHSLKHMLGIRSEIAEHPIDEETLEISMAEKPQDVGDGTL